MIEYLCDFYLHTVPYVRMLMYIVLVSYVAFGLCNPISCVVRNAALFAALAHSKARYYVPVQVTHSLLATGQWSQANTLHRYLYLQIPCII